jgi:hypothetical protein
MQEKNGEKTIDVQTVGQKQTREAVDLGMWLGRRQAFALVAGRCSAADAECIRDMRTSKRYRALKMTWEQFCEERLGLGRSTADQIVRQLDEFGPEFFTLAQLTRVTPAEYRRLKPAVRGHALLHAGEEIPIEAENGPRLAAAIEELRRNAKAEASAGAAPVEELAPGSADLQIGSSERANPALGSVERADLEIGGPRPGSSGAADKSAASAESDPADAMTAPRRGISNAQQSLRAALTELERLQTMRLDMDDRIRLHSLVGYGAHKFNLLQLAARV